MPSIAPTSAADMTDMLRRHYLPDNRPPGGVFAPEIQSPCGARRADLIWLSTTTAGGRHMIGHEVKVSRSDVLVELRDPSKAEPWSQFCNQWYLVIADPSLIDGLDIPEAWGVMSPPSGRRTRSMTILRKAPSLTPSLAADGVARVTAWLNNKYVALQHSHERELNWRDRQIERHQAAIDDLRNGGARTPSPHAKRIGDIASRVEKGLRERQVWGAGATDDDIVAALVNLAQVRNQARSVVRSVNGLRSSLNAAQKALANLPDLGDDELPFGGVA